MGMSPMEYRKKKRAERASFSKNEAD